MFNKRTTGLILLAIVLMAGCFLFKKNDQRKQPEVTASSNSRIATIDELTKENVLVPFVKANGKLPVYYITKNEARDKGWDAARGNLCDVLPGRAIGGDAFFNREGSLPKSANRRWFEADLNYNCGRRNADRLLFSNDGLVYVTYDHYKTFKQR